MQQYMSVYEISPGRYALGFRHEPAYAVVERVTTGPGRPTYRGVRGRRPTITGAMAKVAPSKLLRTELVRVAQFN